MDREDFPARHPGCKAGAPKTLPLYLHRTAGDGCCAHYVCPAPACHGRGRSGYMGRWWARVDAGTAGQPDTREQAA